MRSWPDLPVPRLPGTGQPIRLYDTATGEIRPPSPGAPARMYVCGITPYDAIHLGHAATYLPYDLVIRVRRRGRGRRPEPPRAGAAGPRGTWGARRSR